MAQNPIKNRARKKSINRKMYRQLSTSLSNFSAKEGEEGHETYTRLKRIKSQLNDHRVAASL